MIQVVVVGAGCIGCWVGGALACVPRTDVKVTFVVRDGSPRGDALRRAARTKGLTLLDRSMPAAAHRLRTVPPEACHFVSTHEAGAALAAADLVLLATKRPANKDAAQLIREHARPGVAVVTLQNGVGTASELQQYLGGGDTWPVVEAMVNLSVVSAEGAMFIKCSPIAVLKLDGNVQPHAEKVRTLLKRARLQVQCVPDIRRVTYGKLLINLFNAVNALSGQSLTTLLLSPAYRRVACASITEALRVYKAAGVAPSPWVYWYLPWAFWLLQRLQPLISAAVWLLEAALGRQLDHTAHASMWEDLHLQRPTEVDALNGVIIKLGQEHGVPTPINSRLSALVKEAERANAGLPMLSADTLLRQLHIT